MTPARIQELEFDHYRIELVFIPRIHALCASGSRGVKEWRRHYVLARAALDKLKLAGIAMRSPYTGLIIDLGNGGRVDNPN